MTGYTLGLTTDFATRGKKNYVGGSCVPVLIYQLGDSGLLRKQDNNVQVT